LRTFLVRSYGGNFPETFTPKGFYSKAQGQPRSGATLGLGLTTNLYPEGLRPIALCNPFGVDEAFYLSPRVRCATLGFGIKPLRGTDR
jgi:hypothetical protein